MSDEFDQLLRERSLTRTDAVAAVKTVPTHRPWAATLTAAEAAVFDDS